MRATVAGAGDAQRNSHRLSAISCSRQSSATVLGPRNHASTISVFCYAVNVRYFLLSLNAISFSLSGHPLSLYGRSGRLHRPGPPAQN